MKTAVAYTRVSSDDQVRGTSLETQFEEIREYCKRNDIALLSHWQDAGESAKTADRPGLIKALGECKRRRPSFFIVHRIDRLSRNATDGLAIRAKLRSYNTQILSVTEPVSDDPAGQFMTSVFFAVSQFDNDIRAARSRMGMSAVAAKGGWSCSAPWGFRTARNADGLPVLEIAHPGAHKLAAILRAYAEGGGTLRGAVAELKAMGFDRGKASRIFREPVYGGIIRNKLLQNDVIAAFPGIITPAAWYKLERRYLQDRMKPRRDKPSGQGFVLTVCVCGECGARLKGSNARSKGGRLYPYYRCPNRHINIRAADLDEAVGEALHVLVTFSRKLHKACDLAVKHYVKTSKSLMRVEHSRNRELNKYRTKLASLTESFIDGDVDRQTYKVLQAKYNGKIADLEQCSLLDVDPRDYLNRAVRLVETFRDIRFFWHKIDPKVKKSLLLSLPNPPKVNPVSKKVELDFDQAGVDKMRFLEADEKLVPLA